MLLEIYPEGIENKSSIPETSVHIEEAITDEGVDKQLSIFQNEIENLAEDFMKKTGLQLRVQFSIDIAPKNSLPSIP